MKKAVLYSLFGLGAIGLGTSCVTEQRLYSWKNYETTSYHYYKKQSPEAVAALLQTYEEMIKNQTGTRKVVPPGTYAEYGYLLLQDGKRDEGVKMFKAEMALYPESTTFMNLLIKKFEQ